MEVTPKFVSFDSISTIKMKYGHILVYCLANISDMLLAQSWKMEISSRPFYGFIKMTI